MGGIHNLDILRIAKDIHSNVFVEHGYSNYSRVSVKQIECGGRPVVLEENEFFRTDIKSKGFSNDLTGNSASINRPLRIQVADQLKNFVSWKPNSFILGTDAFQLS